MKRLLVLLGALVFSSAVFGQGIYNEAMSQARGAANKSEAASAGATAQSSSPTAQPSPQNNPALAAAMRNVSSLRTDFDHLGADSSSSSLTNDLAAAAMGQKASVASVAKLAGDLQTILSGNTRLTAQHEKLAQYVHAIFNAGQLPSATQQAVENGLRTILLGGGVAPDLISGLEDDIHAVENETK